MSHASHSVSGMTLAARATIWAMPADGPTPQDLIAQIIDQTEYRDVAEIARASRWNYQRILRWANGSTGGITQDAMADLLVDLELNYEDFGVRPSKVWRDRTTDQLAPIADRLDEIPVILAEIRALALDVQAIARHLQIDTNQRTTA